MSPRMADLPIEPATAQAALAELGLTEAEFWALDADGFQSVMDAHFQRVEAWKAREDGRLARLEAARANIQGVPKDMSIWHAGQEGFIDPAAAREALHGVYQLKQAEESDPRPPGEAVMALLNAVLGLAIETDSSMEETSSEESDPLETAHRSAEA